MVHFYFPMTTKFIGIKEFRQNLSRLSKEAREKNIRFIVMSHSVPLWKVEPLEDEDDLIDELILQKYDKEIRKGLQQVKKGKTFSAEEVRKILHQ